MLMSPNEKRDAKFCDKLCGKCANKPKPTFSIHEMPEKIAYYSFHVNFKITMTRIINTNIFLKNIVILNICR